jgi:hypothetical protein
VVEPKILLAFDKSPAGVRRPECFSRPARWRIAIAEIPYEDPLGLAGDAIVFRVNPKRGHQA